MPNRRHPDGGDSKKKGIWPRRAKKPAPRHGRGQEPVTRWFGTEALPGTTQKAGAKTVTAAPARRDAQGRATGRSSASQGPAELPNEYRRAAQGRLPADYPSPPPRTPRVRPGQPTQVLSAAAPAAAGSVRVAPSPAQAPAEPSSPAQHKTPAPARRQTTSPGPEGEVRNTVNGGAIRPDSASIDDRPAARRRSTTTEPAPTRRRSTTPEPSPARRRSAAVEDQPAPRKGRHRVSDKPFAPAPRRKRRRAPRSGIGLRAGRLFRVLIALLAAAAVAAAGFVGLRSFGGEGSGAEEQAGPTLTQAPTTTLLAGTDAGGTKVIWLSLLSYDPVADQGAVVYVPAHTAVEVPGRGLQGMGDALATGGLPLLLVSAESFFGIEIDHYLELPRSGAETLLGELGPLTVDVPNEVAVAEERDTRRLLLTEGIQDLHPAALSDLLYTVGDGSDDVELGSRHLAFWDSVLKGFSGTPDRLRAAFRNAGAAADAAGNSGGEDGDPLDLVASLAALDGTDLTLALLPVRQVSVGGAELYASDVDEIAEFVSTTLPGVPVATNLARVQVLNGNGSPGVGERVAQKLVGNGFRIELSGNADSFRYKATKVITYDASPEGQALATEARDLLGVGEVQVSGQGQGSVDLTIIVGKDFLRTR